MEVAVQVAVAVAIGASAQTEPQGRTENFSLFVGRDVVGSDVHVICT